MEHWADPWADVDDTDGRDDDVVRTLPQPGPTDPPRKAPELATATGNGVLSGFLDDAQWGSVGQEDWSGGWGNLVREEALGTGTGVGVRPSLVGREEGSWGVDVVEEDTPKAVQEKGREDEGWGVPEVGEDAPKATQEEDQEEEGLGAPAAEDDAPEVKQQEVKQQEEKEEDGDAHASEADTTSQRDEAHTDRGATMAEDDRSIRSSSSPSDASHAEPPIESPRTSIEEDRTAGKAPQPESEAEPDLDAHTQEPQGRISSESTVTELESGDDDDALETPSDEPFEDFVGPSAPPPSAPDVDSSLLSQLFQASKPSSDLAAPPEDPIYATSARKTWYRLTRNETLREFNSGGSDNYVRVNWSNSQIREQVGKIVSRWAAEDRMLGRGPGSRATFYWDQPLRLEERFGASHSRSSSTPHIAFKPPPGPKNMSMDLRAKPAATEAAAAFNWSSELAGPDPWRSEQKSVADDQVKTETGGDTYVTDAHAQHTRSMSMHPAPAVPRTTGHRRTATLISPPQHADTGTPISIDAALNSPPVASRVSITPPPASKPIPPPLDTSTPNDLSSSSDDEDWGEMVQSPTISAPAQPFPTHPSPTPSPIPAPQVLPAPAPLRKPSFASQSQSPSSSSPFAAPGSKDASPIVRLQGALVPNLGVADVSKYVPPSIEQGPIGPGILRKKSAVSLTVGPGSASALPVEGVNGVQRGQSSMGGGGERIAGEVLSDEKAVPSRPTPTPISTATVTAPADPWLDADLSIFESAPPPPSPLASAAVSPYPSSLAVTPALTTSAQQRKSAEEALVRNILSGLPDLGYMLRP